MTLRAVNPFEVGSIPIPTANFNLIVGLQLRRCKIRHREEDPVQVALLNNLDGISHLFDNQTELTT